MMPAEAPGPPSKPALFELTPIARISTADGVVSREYLAQSAVDKGLKCKKKIDHSTTGLSRRESRVRVPSAPPLFNYLRYLVKLLSWDFLMSRGARTPGAVGHRASGWSHRQRAGSPSEDARIPRCRWQGRVGLAQAARELALRATHFPAGNRTVRQILFVRKKSKPEPPGAIVHDLTALYEWQ